MDYSVNTVDYSPDGNLLLITTDKNVLICEAKSVNTLAKLTHMDDVLSATFSPDGRQIMVVEKGKALWNASIRIWDFPPLQDLIDQTRERFKNRPLTPEERRMYYLE